MLLAGATGRAAGAWRASALRGALIVAVAAGVCAGPRPARAAQDPQTLADQAIHRLDLQTTLERDPESMDQQAAPWHLPPETVWLAVIVGLAVLLYAFRDMIPALRPSRGGDWTEEDAAAAASAAEAPAIALEAADDLAAQGRFVEAMHVLLLQALAEIRRRLDETFADSMTSREILRSHRLTDALRAPLRDVVARVEWTYFGEHPAARDDYLACRSSFSALARALYEGVPA